MGATRTIRRAAALAACLALLGACRANAKRTEKKLPSPPLGALDPAVPGAVTAEGSPSPSPHPSRTPVPRPSAVVQTLSSLREQRLQIRAPTVQRQMLSFGAQRLLQASPSKATFRDSKQGQVITEASIGAVRAVAHGPDGSLFAIGGARGALLEPRAKALKYFPHVAFLPDSELLPDLEGPNHFYVYYPVDAELCFYPFKSESSIMPIDARFHLDGCSEPIVQLRDGAIVCRTANGFLRQAPRGSRAEFAYSLAEEPVRLLPGMRLDEFFAVTRAGEVLHLRLAERLQLVARFSLPMAVYAAAANTEALAFILVSDPQAGKSRHWSLWVTDLEGQTRFQSELPESPASAEDDWAANVVEDKNLAISGFEPLVAVGGEKVVSVWDYGERRALFTR
ncbi:MAG TPA: hypothetical protein VFK05_26565 [Polyangiaceae bacterium]|nr:hypothetical protein [Polyangiaceae bacterium]